jgi:anti-sigma factor RsiW
VTVPSPEPLADHALSQQLAELPAPAIDGAFSARVLRKARGELRQPGEGTFSIRGLLLSWETALAPAIVLLAGAAYTVGAIIQLATIFG